MRKATLFITILLILAGCTNLPVNRVSEAVVKTISVSTETPEPQPTAPMFIDEPKNVTITDVVLPLSHIDIFLYSRGENIGEVGDDGLSKESVIRRIKRWEFTEHGNSVEYCYDATAILFIQEESSDFYYEYITLLKPPQLRSLFKVFDQINKGEYSIEATIENDHIILIGNIIDASGKVVWSENFWEGPRDLTPIEKAFLDFRHRVDVYYYHLDYTRTESAERYLDSGVCSESLDVSMEWEDTGFKPRDNYRRKDKYIITLHSEDSWSVLEIAARNAFAYDQIIRSGSGNKLIILSEFDLPVCYDTSDRDKYLFPFSLFDSNNNELPCGNELLVRGWPTFNIITIPKDGYVTIKDWENETWVETLTLNLRNSNALIKYAYGSYPWRFELDYLDEYYNLFGYGNQSPDLSELTLDYQEEEIIEYLKSLDN